MSEINKRKVRLSEFLFKRISASSLAYLRIFIGFCLIYIFRTSFHEYFIDNLLFSEYLNKYDFFGWVKALPIYYFNLLFYLLYVSAFFFAIGYKYRINAIICALGFAYCFLMDKGHYNNHYYLYTIILFFFACTDAHRMYSVDRLLNPNWDDYIPNWQVLLFKFQFFVVYFFGGIAKLHSDWFEGYPMRFWLFDNSFDYIEPFRSFFQHKLSAILFSYGGVVFDLSIGFLLLSRWRKLAILPLLFFHVMNHFLWNIGTFPWVMIFSTPIFFNPSWFKSLVEKVTENWKNKSLVFFNEMSIKNMLFTKSSAVHSLPSTGFTKAKFWVTPILFLWITFQILMPLRQFAFQGSPSWTGQGQWFAWRMMLVDSVVGIKLKVSDPKTNYSGYLVFENYINWDQFRKMSRTPMDYLKFVHFIKGELAKGGLEDPVINMEVWKSVNERSPELMNDTTLNYAEIPYEPLRSAYWMTNWSEGNEKPSFSLAKYDKWKAFIEKETF